MTTKAKPINTNHTIHPKYRADIDGLRAIAVLSVVGFHAFPSWFRGGFIGVDIFFVISGFLISTIIINNLEHNSFSFVDFYSRRIKRIFPTLFVVLTACLVLSLFLLLADESKQLGKHIAGGASFISNFLFWNESGYFDNVADTKPLLHLWSLGIEEQFYIFWPVILWLAWKKSFNLLKITIAIVAISFLLNIGMLGKYPTATFYSPQTRFWELLVGAALAHLTLHKQGVTIKLKNTFDAFLYRLFNMQPQESHKVQHNLLSSLGLILIVAGFHFISKDSRFPGWWALLPTVGAALIISAGAQAWLNRMIFSNRLLVWFGLISYPLYLWHWPLLSFMRILEGDTPTRTVRFSVVLISIFLAWLTYSIVEKPIRFSSNKKSPKLAFISFVDAKVLVLCALMTCIGFIGLFSFKIGGFNFQSHQVNSQLTELQWDNYFELISTETSECFPLNIRNKALRYKDGTVRCRQTAKGNPIQTIALIGDSHAEHLFWGISRHIKSYDNLVYYTYSCLPFLGLKRIEMTECENIQEALVYVMQQPSIHTVVLSAYWADRSNQTDIRSMNDLENTNNSLTFKNGLKSTLEALTSAGKKVVFAFDVPTLNFDPSKCVRPYFLSRDCATSRSLIENDQKRYKELAKEILSEFPGATTWDPFDFLCNAKDCPIMKDGHFIYKDRHHITTYASEYLGLSLVQKIEQLRKYDDSNTL